MRPFVDRYLHEMTEVLGRIDVGQVVGMAGELFECWQRGATTYIFGNGGSASTAQHLACDLFKTTLIEGKPRFRVLSLNDNMPLLSALTNDDGWDAVYFEQLKTHFRPGDVALGISVHGGVGRDKAGVWSQNLLRALDFAKQSGGRALGLVGFDGGAMKDLCDACVVVPVNSTPHSESFHLAVGHLLAAALCEQIRQTA